jgi:hypothetical protein
MDTNQEKMSSQKGRIVYVRSVNVDELPDEVRDQIDGLTKLYAVHSVDGERLALVKCRELAFVLARQNDMSPVTVH